MVRNFLIVGTQRIGSTMVSEALNSHPEIVCGREWTVQVPWYRKIKVAQRILAGDVSVFSPKGREQIEKLYQHQARWLGFKLLFRASDKWFIHPRFAPAIWLDQLENYRRWLSRRSDIYIIHIVRCDAIEWLKSRYLARATGFYSVKQYPDVKLEIPLHSAIKRLRAKDWVDYRLATLATSNPYLRLYYEDLLNSEHDVLLSVVRFLQCDTMKLINIVHNLQRQSRNPASYYISNHDKLIDELNRLHLLKSQL